MKRAADAEDGPPVDPVLAQLDALINGAAAAAAPPAKAARTEAVVAQDPVLAQLDALINPGAGAGRRACCASLGACGATWPRCGYARTPPTWRMPPPVPVGRYRPPALHTTLSDGTELGRNACVSAQ